MTEDRGKKKGRGAVRPTVIEGEAREVRDDAADATETEADEAGARDSRSAAPDAETAGPESDGGENGVSPDGGKATGAAETEEGEASAGESEEPATAGSGTAEAAAESGEEAAAAGAPRGGRTGWKIIGVLALMGASAAGGVWLYDSYGPGREIAALRRDVGRMAGISGEVDARIATALKARDRRLAALEKETAALRAAGDELKQRIADLTTRLEMLSQKAGETPPPVDLTPLRERIGALETARRHDDERLTDLEKRLAALTTRLGAVTRALDRAMAAATQDGGATGGGTAREGGAAGEGGSAGTAAAALPLAALSQKIAAIEVKLAALEETASDTGGAQALREELANLREKVKALRAAVDENARAVAAARKLAGDAAHKAESALAAVARARAEKPKRTPPPVGAAYAALREKVAAGAPYAGELRRLSGFLPETEALAPLAAGAEKGIPTRRKLAADLDALARTYAEARAKWLREMAGEGLTGGLKARLMKVIKVRRKGEIDWAGELAAAKSALASGGLAAAVNRLSAVAGAKPADIAAWLEAAKARLAADAALAALAGDVFRAMSGAAEDAGKAAKPAGGDDGAKKDR